MVVTVPREAGGGGEVEGEDRRGRDRVEGVTACGAREEVRAGVTVWKKDKVTAQRLHDKGTVHTYLHIDVIGMG